MNAMALNNNNQSNAIVILPDWDWDGWQVSLANLGIGIAALGVAYQMWKRQSDPCLQALNKILKKEGMRKGGDGSVEAGIDRLVPALDYVARVMQMINCTSWEGLGKYYEKIRGPKDEFGKYSKKKVGTEIVNTVGNIIDKALAAGCTMKEVLDLIKGMTKGRLKPQHWKELDNLQNLTEAAALAGLAAWLTKVWMEFQSSCSVACDRAGAVSNYLKNIFPDIAIDVLSVIAALIVLVAALIVLIKAGAIIGTVGGAAALLVVAEGSLSAAVEEAKMVPDGMSTDEFIQSLLDQTATIGCGSPAVDTSDDDTSPAGAPVFTDDETDPGGETPPGGGMPPPKAPPTTNSNASRRR